jgi:ParB family chromosome partitioning protein
VAEIIEEVRRPHVVNNSGNNEWYTPSEYIEAAREVMGGIDLDPASCELANKVVMATNYYSVSDEGLSQEWTGNVWLNPPYSGGLVSLFCKKLVTSEGVKQAIVLVNNATETQWFDTLVEVAAAVVFTRGRIKFVGVDGVMNTPLQGQAFLYFGDNEDKFLEEFAVFGWGAKIWNTK